MVQARSSASFLALFLSILGGTVFAADYRVGPDDLLDLRVAAWNAATGGIRQELTISGTYRVGAEGGIAVALVGNTAVAGLTVDEIAQQIESELSQYSRIGETVRVSVGIENYAQIYVTGQVEKPGAFDFASGLTVMKAVALAGGMAGIDPIEGEERNFLNARGTFDMLQRELMYLHARHDRLTAELNGSAEFAGESEPTDQTPEMKRVRTSELAILKARDKRYRHEISSLTKAQESFRQALAVLEDKLKTNVKQLKASRLELRREEELFEQGLVPAAKIFERVRFVSDLESRVLDIERSILLARKELQDHERSQSLLVAARDEENAIELQEVNADIAEAESRLQKQFSLMSEASGLRAGIETPLDPTSATVVYQITRERGDKPGPFVADKTTVLLPGDVVEIQYTKAASAEPSN
ncbi:polysaccharide biosynthesis/export family protein [Roseovarius aestuarii]|uniref:Polysaccharide biosynthesis/export protein n=1 Tax=Roseovarius aestuarii TaxID=475083 RepID=A0A1X7BTC7_9RHOB|nr:polysaccharide biosynthesis/export family protein [Roseovarius aestuarii]SMC12862.1 Polysaccharide biosynthesis/export protein [Roseovarius aestuarii]